MLSELVPSVGGTFGTTPHTEVGGQARHSERRSREVPYRCEDVRAGMGGSYYSEASGEVTKTCLERKSNIRTVMGAVFSLIPAPGYRLPDIIYGQTFPFAQSPRGDIGRRDIHTETRNRERDRETCTCLPKFEGDGSQKPKRVQGLPEDLPEGLGKREHGAPHDKCSLPRMVLDRRQTIAGITALVRETGMEGLASMLHGARSADSGHTRSEGGSPS